VLPDRSATPDRNDRRQTLRSLGVARTSSPSGSAEETKGEMAMIKEVHYLPYTPKCANWLRCGVQPKEARSGMVPRACLNKAHNAEHLGCGGGRVLVSHQWTGKTLTQHRADRAGMVRQALALAGFEVDDHHRVSATILTGEGLAEARMADRAPRWCRSAQPPDSDLLHDRPGPLVAEAVRRSQTPGRTGAGSSFGNRSSRRAGR
jgi:hypothetical protein